MLARYTLNHQSKHKHIHKIKKNKAEKQSDLDLKQTLHQQFRSNLSKRILNRFERERWFFFGGERLFDLTSMLILHIVSQQRFSFLQRTRKSIGHIFDT